MIRGETRTQSRGALLRSKRRGSKKVCRRSASALKLGGSWKSSSPSLPACLHRLKCGDKLCDIALALAQPLEVRDALRRFEAEAEVRRSRGQPALEHLRRRQSTEGVVDLNRGQLRCVELEEALRRRACRIELRLPCRISPARSSGIETGRGRSRDLGGAGQGWTAYVQG